MQAGVLPAGVRALRRPVRTILSPPGAAPLKGWGLPSESPKVAGGHGRALPRGRSSAPPRQEEGVGRAALRLSRAGFFPCPRLVFSSSVCRGGLFLGTDALQMAAGTGPVALPQPLLCCFLSPHAVTDRDIWRVLGFPRGFKAVGPLYFSSSVSRKTDQGPRKGEGLAEAERSLGSS